MMLEVCRAQRRPVEFCQNPERGETLVCLFPCAAILLLRLAVSSPELRFSQLNNGSKCKNTTAWQEI